MPAVRYYTVRQSRTVRVMADNPTEAVQIADAAFTNGQNANNTVVGKPMQLRGNTTNKIRVTELSVTEEL